MDYTNNEKYENAKRRVKREKQFYSHLISYISVNLILIAINLLTSPEYLWFLWVTVFWGIGLIADFLKTFVFHDMLLTKKWEEKKIKKYMEEE